MTFMPGFRHYRTADGNDAFTRLLLHCEGADGSTTFTDSSAAAHGISAGGFEVDTAQSKFGSASAFTGSWSTMTSGSHADWSPGTGDFTLDFWIRFSSLGDIAIFTIDVSDGFFLDYNHGSPGQLRLGRNAVAHDLSGNWSPSTGTWYHVAVSRSGTTMRIFVDGSQLASGTVSSNYAQGDLRIGNYGASVWMDEIRWSKGIARWTSGFTPPTAAYG